MADNKEALLVVTRFAFHPYGMGASADGRWCLYEDAAIVISELRAEVERYEDLCEKLLQWAHAYPIEVFPEPDLKLSHELLEAGGVSLGAVSAGAMRHVITQVEKMVLAARSASPVGAAQGDSSVLCNVCGGVGYTSPLQECICASRRWAAQGSAEDLA